MMQTEQVRCLILACGNTVRGDDGVGPWLAEWAEECFGNEPDVRVLACPQWTPDLAVDIVEAGSVLFVDAAINTAPGCVTLVAVEPAADNKKFATHHSGAPEMLALARDLYGAMPRAALMLTVGVGATEFGEEFSAPVKAALPQAQARLEEAVRQLIASVKAA
jgi:hydrogenase maturation protease